MLCDLIRVFKGGGVDWRGLSGGLGGGLSSEVGAQRPKREGRWDAEPARSEPGMYVYRKSGVLQGDYRPSGRRRMET